MALSIFTPLSAAHIVSVMIKSVITKSKPKCKYTGTLVPGNSKLSKICKYYIEYYIKFLISVQFLLLQISSII